MIKLITLLIFLLFSENSFSDMIVNNSIWNNTTIQGIYFSPSAYTIYASWTTANASSSNLSCGTTFGTYNIAAVDNGIQTSVTSHWAIVAGLIPSTTYYCQATSLGVTLNFKTITTAIPSSTPLISVTWGTPTKPVDGQNNGDTYYNCLSNDNITYVAADDTTILFGTTSINANMSFNKFTSESPLTGTLINGLQNFGGFASCNGDDTRSPKIGGMYCDNGIIYVAYGRQYNSACTGYPTGGTNGIFTQTAGSILKSIDHGVSWSNFQSPSSYNSDGSVPSPTTSNMFGSSTLGAAASFVSYGPDPGTGLGARIDNQDAYAYLVSSDTNWDNGNDEYLIRIPRQSLPGLDSTKVQFYNGGADGSLDTSWSSSAASASPILTSTGKLGFTAMQYMPSTGRYLMLTWYYPVVNTFTNTTWVTYEAPHPWGPFTAIDTTSWPTGAWYNPVPLVRSAANATANGTPFTVLFSGNFQTIFGSPNYYQLYTMTMVANTH